MNVGNLRTGEKILGISGIVLIVSMFLTWWSIDFGPAVGQLAEGLGLDAGDFAVDTTFNAFQVSNFNDIIWFITGAFAIAVALIAASRSDIDSPVALSAVVTVLGALSLLLIVIRLIDPPGELSRDYGLFIGVLAIAGITYGGWLTMQHEGTTFGGQVDRVQDRFAGSDAQAPVAAAPAPPAPAPPAPDVYAAPEDPEIDVYVAPDPIVEEVEEIDDGGDDRPPAA